MITNGLSIDSFIDVVVNKMCAVADRTDVKNYVDIYVAGQGKPDFMHPILELAEQKCEILGIRHIFKHRLLETPGGLEKLSLRKPIDKEAMESFFKRFVKALIEKELQ